MAIQPKKKIKSSEGVLSVDQQEAVVKKAREQREPKVKEVKQKPYRYTLDVSQDLAARINAEAKQRRLSKVAFWHIMAESYLEKLDAEK